MEERDGHTSGCGGSSSGKDECQEAIETLYHFLDGELTEQRRHEISEHLHDCAPCLDAFDFEAELKLVIARKCRDQVPDELRNKVLHALIEASGEQPGGEYRWD